MSFIILHIMGFAFFISLCVSGLMGALNIIDNPGARSSHVIPTPTAGGMGIVAGLAAGLMALRIFYPGTADAGLTSGLAGLGLLIATLGFMDDRFVVPTKLKFLLIGIIALATPMITGVPAGLPMGSTLLPLPYFAAYIGAALWVFVVINAVNFMDGANGLMSTFMLLASAGLCGAGLMAGQLDVAIISGALAAGLAGFLPYNARVKAQIFCGDTGALFTGFLFAAAALRLGSANANLLYIGPLLVLPFLTDVFCTLVVRARCGENLLEAHRSHMYQLMILRGTSHLRVTFVYALWAVMMILIVFIGMVTGLIALASFLAVVTLFGCWRYTRARKQIERKFPKG